LETTPKGQLPATVREGDFQTGGIQMGEIQTG
jgi:hypothetical protein